MKEYIRNQYRFALLDYEAAGNETERHEALRWLARLTELATLAVGFTFADELREEGRLTPPGYQAPSKMARRPS